MKANIYSQKLSIHKCMLQLHVLMKPSSMFSIKKLAYNKFGGDPLNKLQNKAIMACEKKLHYSIPYVGVSISKVSTHI